MDDGLEALLEVPAKPRPREQGAGVEREDLGTLENVRHVVVEQARRQAFGERGFAHARVADEHRVVLAAAAEDFHRPLELLGPANQRVELAGPGACGQVGGVCGQGVSRGRGSALSDAGLGVRRGLTRVGATRGRRRDLGLSVRDVFEDIESRDALTGEQLGRVGPVLLERCRDHVARMDFLPSGALHVEHRRLEHAPERKRLLGLFLLTARELLDRVLEVLVEIAPELRHVGAAGREDPLAVRVVRQRVEQVLERQVRVAPRGRFAVGDGQDDF